MHLVTLYFIHDSKFVRISYYTRTFYERCHIVYEFGLGLYDFEGLLYSHFCMSKVIGDVVGHGCHKYLY